MATPQAETPQSQPALRGRRILICRPEPEGARLAVAFRAAGAQVRLLPTVTREPLPETPERRSILQALDNFQHVIADRKSTRLNSSHVRISYAVFCLKKKKKQAVLGRSSRETHTQLST